jgi:phosphate:Na+ symporter
MSLAAKGAEPPIAAFALVLGANLGTAINPVLEGASGDPAARRLPIGNLVNRLFGVILCLAVLPYVARFMVTLDPDEARAVADFHTLFNLILAAVFFPILPYYASLLRRWLPERVDPADPSRPLYLDAAAKEAPMVALGGAAREALRLADVLESMLEGARDALTHNDRRQISQAKRLDDVLDRLNTAIKTYLTSLDPEAMSDEDHKRAGEILSFATNMEHAGDIVDKGLLAKLAKKQKRGLAFSPEGQTDIAAMLDRLVANLRVAASVFVNEDPRAVELLLRERETFRNSETAATAAHFQRLRAGRIETADTSALHLDILRDLKRVNDHLVAAVDPAGESYSMLPP